jgi:hypothetical protein
MPCTRAGTAKHAEVLKVAPLLYCTDVHAVSCAAYEACLTCAALQGLRQRGAELLGGLWGSFTMPNLYPDSLQSPVCREATG